MTKEGYTVECQPDFILHNDGRMTMKALNPVAEIRNGKRYPFKLKGSNRKRARKKLIEKYNTRKFRKQVVLYIADMKDFKIVEGMQNIEFIQLK